MIRSNSKSEKALKTLGEVSAMLGLQAHVIRFWEENFSKLSPLKYNNRRYYTIKDVELIKQIKDLLYIKNLSIKEAVKYLKNSEDTMDDLALEVTMQKLIRSRNRLLALLTN